MNYIEKLKIANSFLKDKVNSQIDTLLILGSGLGDFTNQEKIVQSIPYHDIPHFPVSHVEGHQSVLEVVKIEEKTIFVMKGRNHYYQGFSDEEMRFPIQLFAMFGVKHMIVTNACGGMNPHFKQGDIMLIEDHINMMGRNPLVGENIDILGPRFVDMSSPYDEAFMKQIIDIAKEENITLQKGVYVGYLGPNYETKSEIKAFRMMGGDAVGMSTVPETIVARHAGIRCLGLSVITNMSTGISKKALSHEEVLETSKTVSSKITVLLRKFLHNLT